MADTPIPVAAGSLVFGGAETDAGAGFLATKADDDATTEFSRKLKLLPQNKDQTTLLRWAINKAWRMASNHKDVTIAYRDSV